MTNIPPKPDYADDFAWVAKPGTIDKPVDVFYVYPTMYGGDSPRNMDISMPDMRAFAKGLLTAQAGVYSEACNLFAPFYRQQSSVVQKEFSARGGTNMFVDPTFKLGAGDVVEAFDYYLEHLNEGRPFILAGHSQGTMTLINLMLERFDDQELLNRMVAAYLIGFSIPRSFIKEHPWFVPATGETDSGVVITYNTQAPGATGSPVCLPDSVGINPVNWKTDATKATHEEHLGAVFFDDRTGEVLERIDNFAEVSLNTENGVAEVSNMKNPESERVDLKHLGRWPDGVYHKFDYAFWYNNLKDNVEKRVRAFARGVGL